MKIGHITLLVKDFDETLNFYVNKVGFQKRRDDKFGESIRWVTVSAKDQPDLELTLVLADTEDKLKALGEQAGDHVFLTLLTDDCKRDYEAMKEKGVKFFWEKALTKLEFDGVNIVSAYCGEEKIQGDIYILAINPFQQW